MTKVRDTSSESGIQMHSEPRSSAIRLLLIPVLIYLVWVAETYLLEGSTGLFFHYQPVNLLLYTIFANIIVGILIPVLCLRPAFMSGAVNMFKVGFRPTRRTLLAVSLTALVGYLVLIAVSPSGTHRIALFSMVALFIPLAVGGVMICWVLIGTHVQAYVRSGGALVSIIAGVIVTAALFGLSFAAHSPPFNQPDNLLLFTCIGAAGAIFFFSVRDVYAASLFVALAVSVFMVRQVDQLFTGDIPPVVYGTAALSIASLVGCHIYLFRNYTTVHIPVSQD